MLSHDELDRLVEQSGDGVIKKSLYCARCGYNLRLLPYRYNCPECGNRYYARALRRKGIFMEDRAYLPIAECLYATLSGTIGVGLLLVCDGQWSTMVDGMRLFIYCLVTASLVLSYINTRRVFRLFLEYKSRHRVIKHITVQRREEALHD